MAIFDLDVYLFELAKRAIPTFGHLLTNTDSSRLSVKNAGSYGLEIGQNKRLSK